MNMSSLREGSVIRRIGDYAGAVRHYRRLTSVGTSRKELLELQRRRLLEMARHAAAASPFYRELYAGIELADDLDVRALPVVTKPMLMERFDEWVTDPRLRLSEVERHLEHIQGDELYLGEYRCMPTGGTTGRRGVFVYDREEWRWCLSSFMRWSELMGTRPRLGRRLRVAGVGTTNPLHVTARVGLSLDLGLSAMRRLDAHTPLGELVAALNEHRPEFLLAYPSMASLLALEQVEGRLHIAPRTVCTNAEVRTEEMTANIRAAWGVEPFNFYGSTEGLFACDCDSHQGMHVFEDLGLMEVVDEHGDPVPDGVRRRQAARYQLHQTHPATSALRGLRHGRAHDRALRVRAPAGTDGLGRRAQRRHPAHDCNRWADHRRAPTHAAQSHGRTLGAAPVQDHPRRQWPARAGRAPRRGPGRRGLPADRRMLRSALLDAGVHDPRLEVAIVAELPREQGPGAKFKLIESRTGVAPLREILRTRSQ